MTYSVHFILIIFLISNSASADQNLFNANDDAPLFLLDSLREDLFTAADANLFASLPADDSSNGDILSSCPPDENEQAFVRARDAVECPSGSPPIPFTTPTLPDFNGIYNILNPKSSEQSEPSGPEKNRPTGPYLFIQVPDQGELVASEPEYYCQLLVTESRLPEPFTIPVCGSKTQSSSRGYLYSWVDRSRILFPTKDWVCPESEFFCCKEFEPDDLADSDGLPYDETTDRAFVLNWDDYQRLIKGDRGRMIDPGVGTGLECRNLKEAGWNGYDSDRQGAFEVVDPASFGIQDFPIILP